MMRFNLVCCVLAWQWVRFVNCRPVPIPLQIWRLYGPAGIEANPYMDYETAWNALYNPTNKRDVNKIKNSPGEYLSEVVLEDDEALPDCIPADQQRDTRKADDGLQQKQDPGDEEVDWPDVPNEGHPDTFQSSQLDAPSIQQESETVVDELHTESESSGTGNKENGKNTERLAKKARNIGTNVETKGVENEERKKDTVFKGKKAASSIDNFGTEQTGQDTSHLKNSPYKNHVVSKGDGAGRFFKAKEDPLLNRNYRKMDTNTKRSSGNNQAIGVERSRAPMTQRTEYRNGASNPRILRRNLPGFDFASTPVSANAKMLRADFDRSQ